jgi:cell division protein FtsQ
VADREGKEGKQGAAGAVIALVVLACLACAGMLGYYVFRVETVEVSGNKLFTTEEIVALSRIQAGENLFAVSADSVRAGFAAEPFLDLVKLERKWPSTVVLHIGEREAAAAVAYDKQYLLVSSDGTVLRMQDEAGDYVVVDGMGVTAAVTGALAQGPTSYQLHVMAVLCEHMRQSACAASFVRMNLRDPAAIAIETDSGIAIRLGTEENLAQKFAWIDNLLPRLQQEGKRYGTLDVSGTGGASYIP